MSTPKSKTPADAFLAYQWKFIEDQTEIFHQDLDKYISLLKEKFFKSRNDQLMLKIVEFLMQPFPDIESQTAQADTDMVSKVTDLEDELHLFKKTFADDLDLFKQHSQEKLSEQKLISTKQKQLMDKREKKMRKELRLKDRQIVKLENSHKLALKVCGELLAFAKTPKENIQIKNNLKKPLQKDQDSTHKSSLPLIEGSKLEKVARESNFSNTNPSPPKASCIDKTFKPLSSGCIEGDSLPNVTDPLSSETLSRNVKDENRWKHAEKRRKLTYDKAYLLELRECASSLVKPEGLPNLEIILDRPVIQVASGPSFQYPPDFFLPPSKNWNSPFQTASAARPIVAPSSNKRVIPGQNVSTSPTGQVSPPRQKGLSVLEVVAKNFASDQARAAIASGVPEFTTTNYAVAPSRHFSQRATAASSQEKATTESPSGARLLSQFLVDQSDTAIKDIVALAGGLVLVADEDNKELKLFHMQGDCLQLLDTKGTCRIAKVQKSTVAVLYEHHEVEILHVMNASIRSQASFELKQDKTYTSIVSVDKGLLGIAFQKLHFPVDKRGAALQPPFGIDIYNHDGKHQTTVDLGHYVSHMCKAEDGIIFCSNDRWGDISKIDVYNGCVIFSHKVPEIPRLSGMAYLPRSKTILACGGKHGNLSVLDEQGQFLKEVYHSKSGGIYIVSVHDDMCVWEGHGMLYIMKFDI